MNIASAIVVYIIIWWCVFFAVLPVGVRQQRDDERVRGGEPGAPANPDLKRKAVLTTGIAFGCWLVAVAIIASGMINFRD